MKKILYIIIILSISNIYADGNSGISGADFLELGVGSRPLGMGEAYTAMNEDINAIYYNPAGLGTLKYPELSINHQELILDSRLENITFSLPLFGGFFAGANTLFWIPSFDKVDIDGEEKGQVDFYNSATYLSYGRKVGPVYLGSNIKYIYQKMDTYNYHSVAIDLGILKSFRMFTPFKSPTKNFFLGFSLNNLGTDVDGDPLPRNFKVGTSYIIAHWMRLNVDISEYIYKSTDLLDFSYGFDEGFVLNTGAEFSYNDLLYFRTGYKFNDGNDLTFGAGFNYAIKEVAFRTDVSYSNTEIFGGIYSVNFTFKLIPKVVTSEDKKNAERYYKAGIKAYIADDIDGALNNFKKAKDYNPYYKSIDTKIKDLEELKKLREENKKFEEEQNNLDQEEDIF